MMRLTRLVLKPMRFELAAMTVASLALTVLAIALYLQVGSLGDLRECLRLQDSGQITATSSCLGQLDQYASVRFGAGRQLLGFMSVLPLVIGSVLGVPIVAREIETGTAPLAWALAGSRSKWLLVRVVRVAPVVLVLLVPPAIASEFVEGRLEPLLDPGASFIDWGTRGFPLLLYAIAAFGIAVGAGALTGRTLPALLVAGAICLLIQQGTHPVLRRWLAAEAIPRTETSAATRGDLLIRSAAYDPEGRPIDDLAQWLSTHQADIHAGNGARLVEFVIPGQRYVEVEVRESGVLIVVAAVGLGGSVLVVRRRSPY